MKENNFNSTMTDADFDARCRTLLSSSEVVAPAPRADLFAGAAPKALGMRWTKWGAAAIVMVGFAFWMSSSDKGPESSSPAEAVGTEPASEITQSPAPGMDAVQVNAPLDESMATDAPEVPSDTPVEMGSSAAPTALEAPESSSSEVVAVSAATEMAASSTSVNDEGALPSPAKSEVESAEPITEEESAPTKASDALELEAPNASIDAKTEAPPAMEDAQETRPKLTLPLTLPSGGGQH